MNVMSALARFLDDHPSCPATNAIDLLRASDPSSTDTTRLVENPRTTVLACFNATGEYTAILTPNATAARRNRDDELP
jgi:hypothetical protein